MAHDNDVVVIGAGPVGATALAFLGRAGIRAAGIERDLTQWTTARAVHFDGETFRTLQALGLGERASAVCKPMTSVLMENEAHEVLFSFPTGQRGSQAWHDDLMFHQPDMEALFRADIASLPSVELRAGTTLTAIEQDDAGVRCHIESAGGGAAVITARWAIACDGANSTVRRLLNIPAERIGSDDPWVVVDGLLHDSPGMAADMVFLGHHSRPALWARITGKRVRMEFKVMPGDDLDEIVTPAAIERISNGLLPVAHFAPDRAAIYTFRARVAERWRVGNVFLAGDAAHQAPPLFGQGLCAGMRDVANLAWKLRLVALGRAGEDLLGTYESERRPHARYWVEQAATMASLLQATDPQTAADRDAYIRAHPGETLPPAPPLGPGLHTGPGDPKAGMLSVQPVLADGTRLDELIGQRFLVASANDLVDALPAAARSALEADPETVVLTDPGKVGGLLAPVAAAAVVVRPDRYILGTAGTTRELEELLALVPTLGLAAAQPA
jgi:3-(3-hydroxy-phenyl)propionate hydroxylase